jgi:hypothetical protein
MAKCRRVAAMFALLAVGACGLDLEGAAVVDGGAPGVPPPPAGDAGSFVEASSPPPSDGASPEGSTSCDCGLAPAPGWTVVAFAADRAAACPGDMTADDLVTDPVAGAGACSCGACNVTTTPSCTTGTFGTTYDQSGTASCGTSSSVTHGGNGGACSQYSNYLAVHTRAVPPAPSGTGVCTAPGVAAAAAQVTDVRACASTGSTCACDPAAPASFHACLRSAGDVACPANAPNKRLVGSGAPVTCGACPCTVTATCSGTITFYSDTACGSSVATVSTAACGATGSVNYASYKWAGTTATSCVLGASPASVSLADVATICCP